MLIDSFYMNGTGGDINLIFRSAGQVVTTDDDGQSMKIGWYAEIEVRSVTVPDGDLDSQSFY